MYLQKKTTGVFRGQKFSIGQRFFFFFFFFFFFLTFSYPSFIFFLSPTPNSRPKQPRSQPAPSSAPSSPGLPPCGLLGLGPPPQHPRPVRRRPQRVPKGAAVAVAVSGPPLRPLGADAHPRRGRPVAAASHGGGRARRRRKVGSMRGLGGGSHCRSRRHRHLRCRRRRCPGRRRGVPDVVQSDPQLPRRGRLGDGGQGGAAVLLEERGGEELGGRRCGGSTGRRRSDSGGGRRRNDFVFVVFAFVDLLVAPSDVVPVRPPVQGDGAERDVGAGDLVLWRNRCRRRRRCLRRRRRRALSGSFSRRFLFCFRRRRRRHDSLLAATGTAAVQGPPEQSGLLLRGRSGGRGGRR